MAGAFAANVVTNEPVPIAALIAVGNTLEALVGAYLLRRFGFNKSLERVRDIVLLVAFAVRIE